MCSISHAYPSHWSCLQELRESMSLQHVSEPEVPPSRAGASNSEMANSALDRLTASEAEVTVLSQASSRLQQALDAMSQRTDRSETQLQELLEPSAAHAAQVDDLAIKAKETQAQISQLTASLPASVAALQQGLDAICTRLAATEGQVSEATEQRPQVEASMQSLASSLCECEERMRAIEALLPSLQEGSRQAADDRELHQVDPQLASAFIEPASSQQAVNAFP